MSQEVELKLSLPRSALPALRRHPLVAAAARLGNAVTLDNTYYDTPDLALRERRIAVRTRRQGRQWLQTIKCAAESAGGLSRRPEWEQPYTGAFDFGAVDAGEVRKILQRRAAELQPVFTTRFRRETREYAPAEGVRILMMIDHGEVLAGERREPICELELELAEGSPLDLLRLGVELAQKLPLLPNDVSKAERGFRLHLDAAEKPMRAEASRIEAGQSPVEAFRSLALSCVRQWQANAAGAAVRDEPEFVHQLRVALRRLRSLLKLFAPALPPDFVAEWSDTLRDNANRFGDARDLDVLYTELLEPVASAGHGPEIDRLLALVQQARTQARAEASGRLDAAEQGRLLLALTLALHELPTNNLIGAADLRTFARLQLARLRKKMRRRFEVAGDLAPVHLHALRIAGKRLRYGLEFFAPLFPQKAVARYTERLVRVQDALGFINDVDVARARLAAWAGDDPELRAAAGFVAGWHGPRYSRLSRRALRDLEPLLWGPPPWRE